MGLASGARFHFSDAVGVGSGLISNILAGRVLHGSSFAKRDVEATQLMNNPSLQKRAEVRVQIQVKGSFRVSVLAAFQVQDGQGLRFALRLDVDEFVRPQNFHRIVVLLPASSIVRNAIPIYTWQWMAVPATEQAQKCRCTCCNIPAN